MEYGRNYSGEPDPHDAGAPAGGEGETLLNMGEAAQAAGTTVQALWVRVQRGELPIHRLVENGRTTTAVALRDILRLYKGHVDAPVEPRPAPGPRPTWNEEPAPQAPPHAHQPPPNEPVYAPPPPSYPTQAPPPPAAPHYPVQAQTPQAPSTAHGPAEANNVVELQAKDRELAQLREELNREREARSRSDAELGQARQVEQSMRAYSERLEMRLEQTGKELAESKKEALTLARALGQAEGQIKLLSPPSDDEDDDRPHQQLPRRRRKPWWKRML